jgi:hypothetical protein
MLGAIVKSGCIARFFVKQRLFFNVLDDVLVGGPGESREAFGGVVKSDVG